MKKRILSLLLAIFMMVGMLPATAFAAEPAEITGVSIIVDGVTYTEGEVIITPDTESIVYTLTGTNFANRSYDNQLAYDGINAITLTDTGWTIEPDANTATREFIQEINFFSFCNNAEVEYSNDGGENWTGTGIFLTYDDGIAEEDEAQISGVSVSVDGVTYTEGNITITPTSKVIFTLTGTNFANMSADKLFVVNGYYYDVIADVFTINAETNTAVWDCTNDTRMLQSCDGQEVEYSNDGQQGWTGTGIYLTYDDGIAEEDKAVITGVSITVDGVTYNSGNVTITPETQSIIYTVTGTNFANVSDDNILIYAGPYGDSLNNGWPIDTEANTATFDASEDIDFFAICDNFEVTYSNDGGATKIGTGIYLTYVRPVPDSTGKIVVDMADYYGDSWNGAAIEIYKSGTLEITATVDGTFNTVSLDYDSTASYEFKWVTGQYDSECSFTIYVDGEVKLEVSDASRYENGETLLTLEADGTGGGDTGQEEALHQYTAGGEEITVYYETLDAALEAATGGTIKLLTDATVDTVVLKPGVTLDLNGCTLTAELLVAMNGAMVTDGGADCVGGGLLKIHQANLALAKDNGGIIPVWNGVDGYVFTKVTFQQLAQATEQGAARYIFLPSFSNAEAAALLSDGGRDNGIQIKACLIWNDGRSQQFYTYDDSLVAQVFDGTGSLAFDLNVTGIGGIADMVASPVVVTDSGAQATATGTALVSG